MPTLLTALLDKATLSGLFAELMPLHFRLDDGEPGRTLWIDRPDLLDFVPGSGVRIRTRARLTYARALPPVTVQSATFLLTPWLSPPPHPGRLNFGLSLEELALKGLLAVAQGQVKALANPYLAQLGDTLGWSFGQTLAVRLGLPPRLHPVEGFTLAAGAATVEVVADALRLTLPLDMHFTAAQAGPVSP